LPRGVRRGGLAHPAARLVGGPAGLEAARVAARFERLDARRAARIPGVLTCGSDIQSGPRGLDRRDELR